MKWVPITLMLVLGLAPAVQAATDAEWRRCAALADPAARLACFDAAAAKLPQSLAAPAGAASAAAASAQPSNPATPLATRVARFGVPESAPNEQLAAIESQVLGLVDGWGPGQVFQLTNGQRWYVSDGSSAVLHVKDPKVVVRRAAMGTYRIEFEGSNHTARVKRMP